jgi:hypothetical protein
MPYTISFSDPSDPSKPDIVVNDNIIDERLSVAFIGKNSSNYSSSISKNFLHLLENFASPIPPPNPVEGQLWYNSIDDSLDTGLKIYDKTAWMPVGFIQKDSNDPNTLASSDVKINNGDLFVDTRNNQLYIKTGDEWRLVGPNTKQGEETSAKLEVIIDTTNKSRSILVLYVNNNKLAIVSDSEFTPKSVIEGFNVIKQGINLSTAKFQLSSNINKVWGVSEKAESLIIDDSVITANKFLRSDVANKTSEGFTIGNNNGLTIGSNTSLAIYVEENNVLNNDSILLNKSSNSKISFKLTNDSGVQTVLTIAPGLPNAKGKVGINNSNPVETLDINGTLKVNDVFSVTADTDSINLTSGSIKTAGGAAITKNMYVGGRLVVTGTAATGALTVTGAIAANVVTTSGSITAPTITATARFNGNLYGNADTATFLTVGAKINIRPTYGSQSNTVANDIENTGSTFTTVGGLGSFDGDLNLNLNNKFIEKRNQPNSNKVLLPSDLILISRQRLVNNQSQTELFKLSGEQLLSRAAPAIGSIIVWPTSATIPNGYIRCDGRALTKNDYSSLSLVLGGEFKDSNDIFKFLVPDLSPPSSGTIYIIFTGRFI